MQQNVGCGAVRDALLRAQDAPTKKAIDISVSEMSFVLYQNGKTGGVKQKK